MLGSKGERKLNIAVFGHKRIPSREGGVEIVVEELATRMAANGIAVTCFNRSGHHVSGREYDACGYGKLKELKEREDIRIRTVPTLDRKGFAAITSSFFAALYAGLGRYDVVHIHAEGPAAFCWIPKLFGKRVIVTIHGLDWQRAKWKGLGSRYIRFGEKTAVRLADEIIVLSRNVQAYFKAAYNRDTIFIPNGVSAHRKLPADNIREVFGLDKDSYILFLGRIVPEKGAHLLIEAFKQLDTDRKLVIAGGSSNTDRYMTELKKEAAEDKRIVFTGFVQGEVLEELYSNAYVYCLPSNLEGMPLSLLEAMSYGNCCLVSDIAECTEVVEDKAVTFKHGDAADLLSKLRLLCEDPALVQGYKEQSADFICSKYSWDDVTEQTMRLYGVKD